MSYEGTVQVLCANGHYSECDHWGWAEDRLDGKAAVCCHCGAAIVWENEVDDTNGFSDGYVSLDSFMVSPVVYVGETIVKRAVYRIPSQEETAAARRVVSEEEYLRFFSEP